MAKSRPHWRQVRWRSGSSTASERAGRAPTGQRAESVAQQQGLARSVGARDGHEGPGRHIRALTPRLSPPRTLPERRPPRQRRGRGRCRSRGRQERAHRSLRNRADAVSHKRPQPHCCCWYSSTRTKPTRRTGTRPVSRFLHFYVTADRPPRSPSRSASVSRRRRVDRPRAAQAAATTPLRQAPLPGDARGRRLRPPAPPQPSAGPHPRHLRLARRAPQPTADRPDRSGFIMPTSLRRGMSRMLLKLR